MENQSHSSSKKASKPLRVSTSYLGFIKKNLCSDYLFDRRFFETKFNTDNLSAEETQLILALKRTLKEFSSHLKKPQALIKKKKKRVNQIKFKIKEGIKESLSHLEKKELLKTRIIKEYHQIFSCTPLYNNLHNIHTLPGLLLNIEFFKSHDNCQIFVHEKGNPIAQCFIFSHSQGMSTKRLEAKEFNQIFKSIKKSKNRLFTSNNFYHKEIFSWGTFLAKEITYPNYNLIFIFSRNEFLPPSNQEIKKFEEIMNRLFPLIEPILFRSKIDQKLKNTLLTLEYFPFPLTITNERSDILFSNTQFNKNDIKESSNIFEHSLSEGNNLTILFPEKSNQSADIYHFERVSLLGELLNTLKHELSNPLFGLNLASDLLQSEIENTTDSDTLQIVKDISLNSLRCQKIIKNFSFLYQNIFKFSEFDLKQVIEETTVLTKSESRGFKKTIQFEGFKEKKFYIFSNPTWISQILFNLIINSTQALKSLPIEKQRNGFIDISISKKQKNIIIAITDNGPGIPSNNIENIFKPFFTTKEIGTGLGLNICRNLANKLGGNIKLKTSSPQGTQFELTLPYENTSDRR